jgi:hypothetical protein
MVCVLMMAGVPARPAAQCAAGWSVISSPNGSGDLNSLSDVAVVGNGDLWAVGQTGNGNASNTLIDGTFPVNYLVSASAVSATDIWAVGYSFNGIVSDS